jgi:hypothetical protein
MDIEIKERIPIETKKLPVAFQLELHRIIEVDAYLRAEADGFRRSPLDYWLAAERDCAMV